ncbi:hypothetical protein E2C01_025454 [Portunus trituberculatus]|uniref:Uncharacterized protein n=1 Tax=Portunus trituberculatus TaxID=210409 RepID=A0A5B7EF90_PORTR|nr:hypothetical protein [Portunus trituberculatus]
MKILRNSSNEKQVIIEQLQSKVNVLEQRINIQEDHSRRNNLRIAGLQEQPGGETWEQTESKGNPDVVAASGIGDGGCVGAPVGATAVSADTDGGASASPNIGDATKKTLRTRKKK